MDGFGSLTVMHNGSMITKLMRSPNAPVVQINNVVPDMPNAIGQLVTTVNWTATDADKDMLMTAVDFSTDMGQTWNGLYYGPDTNYVSITSSHFSTCATTLLRLRVNDGFNETTVISTPFAEGGNPPIVSITSPKNGSSTGNEEALHCAGNAVDDRHQVIPDGSLIWYSGKKQIGQGNSISVSGLAPITQTLTLVATDYMGRSSSASVMVKVLRSGLSKPLPDPGLFNTNLVLWLTADTELVTDTNGLVSFWGDQSGWGNDASQTDPSAEPMLAPGVANGFPAVQFGASGNQSLIIPTQVITSPQFTIVAVMNDQGMTDTSRGLFSSASTGSSQPVSFGLFGAGPVTAQFGREFVNGNAVVHSPQLFSVLTVVVGTNRDGANITTLYQNQEVIAQAATPAMLMASLAGPYAVGKLSGASGDTFWRGDIAELLVYNTALTSDELQMVYGYLQQKYEILPTAPQIDSVQVLSNVFRLNFTAQAYRPYQVLYTDALDTRPVIWRTLTNFYASGGISALIATDSLTNKQRFYQLVVPTMDPAPTNPQPPTVLTEPATLVTSNGATFNGSAFASGNDTTAWFQYGGDTNYGLNTFATVIGAAITNPVAVTYAASLSPGTLYHFQLVASNSAGVSYGGDQFVTTAAPPPALPTVLTFSASSVAATSVTLNGSVNGNGLPIAGLFEYGLDTSYGSSTYTNQFFTTSDYYDAQTYSTPITGLSPNTTYHFRAIAYSSSGEGFGADATFTTTGGGSQSPPTVQTLAASSVTSSGAVLNGSVDPNGGGATTYFEYGTSTSYGEVTTQTGIGTAPQSDFQATISGLNPSTTYHYRINAVNGGGITYGADVIFTTSPGASQPPPIVQTLAASSVTTTGAVLNGSVNPNGGGTTTYFEYGTNTSYGWVTTQTGIGTASQGDFQATLTGLSSSTTYHYRINAVNSGGITYGADTNFTTVWVPVPPTLLSPGTSLPSNSAFATTTPNFTYTGESQASSFNIAIYAYPTGSLIVNYSAHGSNQALPAGYLELGKEYQWSMTAFNSLGNESVSSSSLYFSTAALPSVTTSPATNVLGTTAQLAGYVNPNGAPASVYFEFGTTTSYGTSTTHTGIGTSAQRLIFSLSGLSRNTTYHYRINAVNGLGLSQGADVSFKTED